MTAGGSRFDDLARTWLDAGRKRTPRERLLGMVRHAGALVVALVVAALLVRPIVRGRVAPLPAASSDRTRFGLPLSARRKIFSEIAATEAGGRHQATIDFPGDAWSAQDDAAAVERDNLRSISFRHKISLTQGYLVLDEGIRQKWPVPRQHPLPGTIVPLHPRRTW